MNRRTAIRLIELGTIGVGISSCLSSEQQKMFEEMYKSYQLREKHKQNEWKIYNELPKHVHIALTKGEFIPDRREFSDLAYGWEGQKGCGIVLDKYYLTCTHIVRPNSISKKIYSPFTPYIKITGKIQNPKTTLNDLELEELIVDEKNDIAIFRLPKNLDLPEFPCPPRENVMLGDRVFVIGYPLLERKMIRSGRVTTLNSLKDIEKSKGDFGISNVLIPGDSGSPVVDIDYNLLGLGQLYFANMGFVKKIGEYLKYLK